MGLSRPASPVLRLLFAPAPIQPAAVALVKGSYILPDFGTPPPKSLPLGLEGHATSVNVGGKTIPVEYVHKEVCRAGRIVRDVNGNRFALTRELFDRVVENFKKMSRAGVEVFLPTKHEDIKSSDNRGYVIALKREGDGLFATEKLIGEDAILDAARNGQSVMLRHGVEDDQGNTYDWALTHVALCPDPQVSGLGGLMNVAASRTAGPAIVLRWADAA